MVYPGEMGFAQFREFLRAFRRQQPFVHELTLDEALEVAGRFVPSDRLQAFWSELVPDFIRLRDVPMMARRGEVWELSETAVQLSTKGLRRIKHAALERLKVDLIARAKSSRSQNDSPYEVGQLLFFGSAIGPAKTDYGDVDIVIRPVLKEKYKDLATALKSKREWRDYNYHPDGALTKYMRNRSGFVHATDFWFVQENDLPFQVVYSVPDFEGRLKR